MPDRVIVVPQVLTRVVAVPPPAVRALTAPEVVTRVIAVPEVVTRTVAVNRGPEGEVGATGPNGAPGSVWREGSGAPSAGLGINGDFYLNDATGDVYKKTAGVYNLVASIRGPTGANGGTGATGATGPAGTPGSVWREGTGAPSNGLGVNGDLYLNDANGDVYQKAAGAYSVVANIKGSTGSTGGQGPQGDPGTDGDDGVGVPTGGTAGQFLRKQSGTDFDTAFAGIAGGEIASGTVPTARLGSGTADATTFLRGDQTYAVPAGGSTDSLVEVTKSANQTITTSTVATLTFDTELDDTDAYHSTVSNTGRLTAPFAGRYRVWALIHWANNTTGMRSLILTVNGTTVRRINTEPVTGGEHTSQNLELELDLANADYVEAKVFQSSGGNLDIVRNPAFHGVGPVFGMRKVGA